MLAAHPVCQQREDWLPRNIEPKGLCPYGQQETYGLTSDEAQGEIRRIKERLDAGMQSPFDSVVTATEQERFHRTRMMSLGFAVNLSQEERFEECRQKHFR